MEPQWCVVSDREIGDKVISHSDRALLNMFMVSDYVDSHFSYSKGSPLYATFTSKIAKDNRNSLNRVLKDIVREAYEHIKDTSEFDNFKTVTDTIRGNALDLGLTLSDLQTILEYKDNTYTDSNISLHTDGVPFRLQGKGSKRLLSIAIQYGLVQDGGIVLIDEIEQGLEPDRIRNLTNILAHSTKGQVFITTHSRDVVLEPTADQIFLMKKGAKSLQNFDKELQGTLRSKPEAFFAKRIISCEGATEEGIIRSFGKHLRETENCGLESKGIVHIDGGGSNKFYDLGIKFNNLGFDTLVFCDDDNREVDDDKKTAIAMGVNVTLCEGELAIEDQLFKDLPWTAVCELIEYAIREHAGEKQILPCEGCSCATVEELRNIPKSNQYDIRIALGRKAKSKKGAWFKNINHGEFLGEKWVEYLGQLDRDSRLYQEYKEIVNWIQHV